MRPGVLLILSALVLTQLLGSDKAGAGPMIEPRTGTTVYVSFRHAATDPSRDEITVGISFGGATWFNAMLIGHNS